MKNSRLGLMSLATLLSVGAAFASKPTHQVGTTYYAISDGTGTGKFSWTTTKPSNLHHCISGGAYCTIVTKGGFVPSPNVVPTPAQATLIGSANMAYSH